MNLEPQYCELTRYSMASSASHPSDEIDAKRRNMHGAADSSTPAFQPTADSDAASVRAMGPAVYDSSRNFTGLPSLPNYIMNVRVDPLDPTNPSKNSICVQEPTRRDYENAFSWNALLQFRDAFGNRPPKDSAPAQFIFPVLSTRLNTMGPLGNIDDALNPEKITNGRPGQLNIASPKDLKEAKRYMSFDGFPWTKDVCFRTSDTTAPVCEKLADSEDPKHRDVNFTRLIKQLRRISDWILACILAEFSYIPKVEKLLEDRFGGKPFAEMDNDTKVRAIAAMAEDLSGARLLKPGAAKGVPLPHGLVMNGHICKDFDAQNKPKKDATYEEALNDERLFMSSRIAFPPNDTPGPRNRRRRTGKLATSAPTVAGPSADGGPATGAAPYVGDTSSTVDETQSIAEQAEAAFALAGLVPHPVPIFYAVRDAVTHKYHDAPFPAGKPLPEGDVAVSASAVIRLVINSSIGSQMVRMDTEMRGVTVFGLANCQRASAQVISGMSD